VAENVALGFFLQYQIHDAAPYAIAITKGDGTRTTLGGLSFAAA
jgi:hypothetical protein